ncbi:MAG TPA: TatD family hydrolase, partial [Gammaproteobacteria bacterium]
MLVDSHCHLDRLDLEPFGGDLANVLQQAGENGVGRFLCVAIDRGNIPDVIAIAERFDNVYASVGVHPNEEEDGEVTTDELIALSGHPKVIAIGETGLDYFRSEGGLEWQKQRFRNHIAAAKACRKPLIIHSRDAREDTIRLMREEGAHEAGGIMHCFVEDWETAQQAMEMGFYISFSGIVTFRNAEPLREVARRVPAERLLVETDSPYLAP